MNQNNTNKITNATLQCILWVSYLFVAKLLGASAGFRSVLSISKLVLLSFKHKNDF